MILEKKWKTPCSIGNASSNAGFFIVMLVFGLCSFLGLQTAWLGSLLGSGWQFLQAMLKWKQSYESLESQSGNPKFDALDFFLGLFHGKNTPMPLENHHVLKGRYIFKWLVFQFSGVWHTGCGWMFFWWPAKALSIYEWEISFITILRREPLLTFTIHFGPVFGQYIQ